MEGGLSSCKKCHFYSLHCICLVTRAYNKSIFGSYNLQDYLGLELTTSSHDNFSIVRNATKFILKIKNFMIAVAISSCGVLCISIIVVDFKTRTSSDTLLYFVSIFNG